MSTDILNSQKGVSNEDIYQLLQTINTNNIDTNKRLERIETSLSKDIKEVQAKVHILEEENKKLKDSLLEVQKRQKKYNLIIYGVEETETNLCDTILDIIKTKLEILCETPEVRDIYRIGKVQQNSRNHKPRPVLLELTSYKKKSDILKSGIKLKGTGIYVSNDLTLPEIEERKILTKHLKQARAQQYNAKIYKGGLLINGDFYSVKDLQNSESDQFTSGPTCTERQLAPTTLAERDTNSAPSTPTLNQIIDQDIIGETRGRILRSKNQDTGSDKKITDKKRRNSEEKEEKDYKKKKNQVT